MLANAKRPLVLIGLGIDPANATRIRQWVNDWDMPVAVTPKVKGIVDETGANFVGVVGGMAADDVMCEALKASDLLIGLGLDPVEIDSPWHAELPIHWILEAANVGGLVPPGTQLVDHARFLDALLGAPPPSTWPAPFREFQQKRREKLNDRSGAPGVMWPGDIVQALAGVLPPETIVTTDVGSHKYLFGQFWPSREPQTFWMSNGLSGMAYGLSAAIGAKLARPDVPVLAAVGDGGFSMNAQELETAERVGAPFVTVVLEDGSYSLIKLAQAGKKLDPYRVDFGPIDTVKMAEACGVDGLRTTNPGRARVGREARRRAPAQPGHRRPGQRRGLPPAVLSWNRRAGGESRCNRVHGFHHRGHGGHGGPERTLSNPNASHVGRHSRPTTPCLKNGRNTSDWIVSRLRSCRSSGTGAAAKRRRVTRWLLCVSVPLWF